MREMNVRKRVEITRTDDQNHISSTLYSLRQGVTSALKNLLVAAWRRIIVIVPVDIIPDYCGVVVPANVIPVYLSGP